MAGGTLKSGDDDESISDINIIPLVDIVLVLLIIFMVTAKFLTEQPEPEKKPPGIEVELPAASTGEDLDTDLMRLTINKNGELFLNNEKADEAKLAAYVKASGKPPAELEALVAADKDISHGDVVGVVDYLRTLGVVKFAINTKPQTIN